MYYISQILNYISISILGLKSMRGNRAGVPLILDGGVVGSPGLLFSSSRHFRLYLILLFPNQLFT